MINIGIFTGSLIAYVVPTDSNDPNYMSSNAWRIVFGFPLILQFGQILGLIFVVKHDSLNLETAYLERHEKPEVYQATVKKIYYTSG